MYLSTAPAASVALLLFAAFHLILLRTKQYSVLCRSLVYFLVPSLTIIVLMSSLEWVRMNGSLPRYIIPAVFLLALDMGYLAAESLKLASGFHRWKHERRRGSAYGVTKELNDEFYYIVADATFPQRAWDITIKIICSPYIIELYHLSSIIR
jgi:hypothetical protein